MSSAKKLDLSEPSDPDAKQPFPWFAAGMIAAACLIPWVLVGVGMIIVRGLFAPAVPHLGGLDLAWLVPASALLALLLLGYEILFKYLAIKIVGKRPWPDFDTYDHDLLIEGYPETGERDADRTAAEKLFETFRGAISRLTKTSSGKQELDPELTSPGKVIEAIAGERGLGVLDRDGLFDRLTHAFDHMQGCIDGEYSAIASRVGWLLASQAFLLSAFVAIVNAERVTPVTQFWLAVGVAFTGAVVSFVLSLGSMFGHALIESLKKPRDELERRLRRNFGIRRCGVPSRSAVHILGHSATRYVPCVTYVAWVALTLAAVLNLFVAEVGPRTVLQGPVKLSQGWVKHAEASPAFRPEQVIYPRAQGDKAQRDDRCPTLDQAQSWVDEVVRAWKSRADPGPEDALLLIGGADRTRLGADLQKQIDSNMALARGRAETVRKLLEDATKDEDTVDRITPKRVLITVTGPRIGEPNRKGAGRIKDCSDRELNRDRTVEVWLPGLPLKPEN